VEATLDFPEEDIEFIEQADARGQLAAIVGTLDSVLDRARQGALLREGMNIVLAGQPNVGKSSLLNALAGAELAIVTAIPGTTRDKVRETIQIEGVPVHVIDTAGLRDLDHASDEVERIGITRSWRAIEDADAVVLLHDLTRRGEPAYDAAQRQIEDKLHVDDPARVLHVFNKADLAPAPSEGIALSAKTGTGLEVLRRALLQRAGWHASPEGVFIARTRHVQALRRTREHLLQAQEISSVPQPALDLFAEELRLAHNALGEITGAFSVEDLLGEIFSRFCIGK
jgi:tRNA modification GTPase